MCNISGVSLWSRSAMLGADEFLHEVDRPLHLQNAHGGFLAWLIDHCSSLSIFCLSSGDRWLTSGVSTNIK